MVKRIDAYNAVDLLVVASEELILAKVKWENARQAVDKILNEAFPLYVKEK